MNDARLFPLTWRTDPEQAQRPSTPKGAELKLRPISPTAKAPAQAFTGDVYVTPIYRGEDPSRMIVAMVRFAPGAHTDWHSHALGQTLHVTDGIGLVATRDGTVIRMRPGDTVYTPPGEDHWHGAAAKAQGQARQRLPVRYRDRRRRVHAWPPAAALPGHVCFASPRGCGC